MNIYHVSGQAELLRQNRNSITECMRHLDLTVEAKDADDALERAQARVEKEMGVTVWAHDLSAELVRELTEAEKMQRIGAPTLFEVMA